MAAARGAEAWTPVERRSVLEVLDRVAGMLSTASGDVLLAERSGGTWRRSGDPSFEAWRGRTSRAGAGDARRQVRRAEAAERVPAVRDALVQGATTTAHLDALAQVVQRAAPAVQDALARPDVQAELAGAARRMDARAFATVAARTAARLDPAAHERSHQAQRAARHLHLADTPDGTRISGLLDRMTGHRLRLALEAVSPRPVADDDRSPEQRRADALETLAEAVLKAPETTSGASVRPHVSFHMTEETWAGLRALSALRAPDGVTARGTTGGAARGTVGESARPEQRVARGTSVLDVADAPAAAAAAFAPVTLDDGTPVPLSEVARALCDCELTRIVADAQGAVLDVGRTQRTYTGVQRRAVVARDRSCAWPGCAAHARWCEVHHIRWWDRDVGPTSVDNGVLLCSFHHHEVHRRDLSLRRLGRGPSPGDGVAYEVTDRGYPAAVSPPRHPARPRAGRTSPPEASPLGGAMSEAW